jgi:hypothetical protein
MLRHMVIGAVAAFAFVLAACEREGDTDAASLPYAREYPGIAYAKSIPAGRLGRFAAAVERGNARLVWHEGRGYLDSVLAALEIDPASQVLVFSRTSVRVRAISPETPRAIYFNDDTYVAWTWGGQTLELASHDPELGPVFYTLDNREQPEERPIERQFGTCLRCHDTYGLSGGGVPRFLLGSGYTGTDGELVSHEAWILTSQATPLASRWGGWYVTGRHGDAVHLGNIVVRDAEDLKDLESLRVGNIDDLSGLFDTSGYLRPTSDIVALMVLEHQVEVQNLMSRLGFESARAGALENPGALDEHVDALLHAMLMTDEIELSDRIEGGSGFAGHFESLGPFDAEGRSLRELDLETRLFRYPLSYLIYSDEFAALSPEVRDAFYTRLHAVLEGTPAEDGLTTLSVSDRTAIAAILSETLPDYRMHR